MAAEWHCRGCLCGEDQDQERVLLRHGLAFAHLTPTEAAICAALLLREAAVVSRGRIFQAVWPGQGLDALTDAHILRVNTARMRPVLLAHGWCLEAVIARGLRLHRPDDPDPQRAACHPRRAPWAVQPMVRPSLRPWRQPGTLAVALRPEARRLRAGGLTQDGIALELGVSRRTVERALS